MSVGRMPAVFAVASVVARRPANRPMRDVRQPAPAARNIALLLVVLTVGMVASGPAHAASLVACDTVTLAQPADTQTTCYAFDSPGGPSHGLLRAGRPGAGVGVIFLHGRGATPNSAVVRQLRSSLANAGYTTLSMQNPLPADTTGPGGGGPNGVASDFEDYEADLTGADFVLPETHERISRGMALLAGHAIDRIVLAGFSLGSRLAAEHIARGQQPADLPIVGFIGLGMRAVGAGALDHTTTLAEISVPVLDVFGDGDTTALLTAGARRAAFAGAPADYTQVVLDCAASLSVQQCHTFNGGLKGADDRVLETTVRDWMTRIAPIPEPSTLALAGAVLLLLPVVRTDCVRRTAAAIISCVWPHNWTHHRGLRDVRPV